MSREKGFFFERHAAEYLAKQQCQILQRNYQCKLGEIDLVILDQSTLAFVEVKYRNHQQFGGARHSINYHKQQKIIRTAHCFLQQYCQYQSLPCRFDALLIQGQQCEWIQGAFSA